MITLHLNSLLRTLKSYDLKALYRNSIISVRFLEELSDKSARSMIMLFH